MNIKRAALIPFATLVALAVSGVAVAHNASASPSCAGLSWSATNYAKEVVNSIVVRVDGVTVHQDLDFKASDTGTYQWSQTAAHAWSVGVDAPGTEFDRNLSGVWQACQTAPTTTVVATTTTIAATTSTSLVSVTTVPVATDPAATTTTVVAVDIPPVPPTTVALDVATLTPVEPALPATGANDGVLVLAVFLVLAGFVFLAIRGRRVP